VSEEEEPRASAPDERARRDGTDPYQSRATAPGLHAAVFRPARGLANRHLQTIWAPLLRRPRAPPLSRERWSLSDGDFLDVDRLPAPAANPGAPRLLVLHGLEGSSEAAYARGLLGRAHARGLGGLALNFRSCSGEPNRLARSYHSGETGDLAYAVERLRSEAPGAPLLIAGISLGANVLVKWLGEVGASAPREVRACAAISTPFELALCAAALDGPGVWARLYRERFLSTLLAKARAKAARFPGALPPERLRGLRTLTEFDDRVTAPVHGFAGAADYYARSSSGPFVSRVRVPLLLLNAADDPFIPPAALPRDAVRTSDFVRLEISERGGHVGFVAGSLRAPRYWAEERALQFLEEILARK
jgi:predicted alpha/beta-fold hydrolase